ncbi:MAG: TolC family protein [Bacteroidetes bacterium]|nr:TolC family protein [Bacteroidota bacterium]
MQNIKIIMIFLVIGLKANAQEILELDRAIEIALKNNYSIIIAKNDALLAKTNNTLGNAGFLPNVGLNFGQTENINDTRQVFFNGEVREGDNVTISNMNSNLQLQWTIFDGFHMFATRNMLEEFEKIGELNARIRIDETISQVIGTYYAIVQKQKQILAIKNAIEISTERKRIAEERLAIGSSSGLEALQASVDVNADSSALLRQEFDLINTKAALNELLARGPEIAFAVTDAIVMGGVLKYEELLQKTQLQNPELLIAQRNTRIADLSLRQARSSILPTVSVVSGLHYNTMEAQIGILQSNVNRGVNYGLTASWTIFNGFTQKTRRQVAQIEIMNNDMARHQSELRIKNELYQLYIAYVTSKSLVDIEQKNLNVAQRNLNVSTERMKLGAINALELREAQRSLIDAEFRLIMAEYEAKLTETELLRLSGQLILPG